MKIKIVLILSMLFTMGLAGYSQEYSINPPEGWEKKSSAAIAQYQKGTGTFILTADAMPSNANTPDSYIDFVKGKLKSSFKDISFEKLTKGMKDKYETRELFYTVKMYGMILKYDVLYIFKNGKAFTLTSSNVEGSINKQYLSEIQAFFTSFTLK